MHATESPAATDVSERITRRTERMLCLINLGGTVENYGSSLHVAGFRLALGHIAEMDESVWNRFKREVKERVQQQSHH